MHRHLTASGAHAAVQTSPTVARSGRNARPRRTVTHRPSTWVELAGQGLLKALSPKLPTVPTAPPPAALEPATDFEIDRTEAPGRLAATWFPADGETARGVVLLLHPWHGRGQAYFHRHRRIPVLRDAGYHVMSFDFGGIGASGPTRRHFADRDVLDAVRVAKGRAGERPLHLWGVCLGGFYGCLAMLEATEVDSAFFEDVTPHPLTWSRRRAPWGRPAYRFFQTALPSAYRFLDLFEQAPRLSGRPTAWVSGAWNDTVLTQETREIARRAGGRALIVDDAKHLECMRRGRGSMVELALGTFAMGPPGRP
ncbi:MAG: alpha/beta fold hydrolase [Acidobacteriota bacterium]